MPRIRSIKPEFWTDSKVRKCSPWARLLFLGSLNFSDDEGYMTDDADELRVRILPSDNIDATALVDELVSVGLLERLPLHSGGFCLHIKGFKRHQIVSHPKTSGIRKKLAISRVKTNTDSPIRESSGSFESLPGGRGGKGLVGNGVEGKGKEVDLNGHEELKPALSKAVADLCTKMTGGDNQ